MGDPTPLILKSETPTPRVEKHKLHIRSLDETIELCMGDFGWAQLFQATLVSLAWVFDAQQTFVSVFTDANPTWHCINNNCYYSNEDICKLPRDSWAWDMPVSTSIVSEWSLECAGSTITGLPTSSFFMGCFVGGIILAPLADSSSLGRKNLLLLTCLIMSLTGIFTVFFSTNVWVYSALRFVSGLGRSNIPVCALVLSTELVGKRWRGQVGIIGFFFFTLGFLSLPAIAYLNRGSSWRLIYLWTCVPLIFYCLLVHFLAHESPRWLFLQGRKQEFIATLKSIAAAAAATDHHHCSNVPLLSSSSSSIELELEHHLQLQDEEAVVAGNHLYSAIKMLLEKSWAFRRLSAVLVAGFGIGMVYYGMPLGVGSLDLKNLYLSVTFTALSELPASLATFFLIGSLNRKGSVLGFTTLSGICSIMCVMVVMFSSSSSSGGGMLQIGLEMVSFFSACTAFNVLLIYTLELFPTCVRNSAMSLLRQALVLGGAFSPMLVATSRKNGPLLSFGVFGVTIGLCGLFVTFLPETRGQTLCDTMDEEEHKFKDKAAAAKG